MHWHTWEFGTSGSELTSWIAGLVIATVQS